MIWEVSLMTTWTSAGGRADADLGLAYPGSKIRREVGGRTQATLILDAPIAWELAKNRAVIRLDRRDRQDYVELRIASRSRKTRGVDGVRFTVTGEPRWYDLADADLVRETIAGRTITRFSENLTPRQYLERFFFVNLAADGLTGLALRTVEFDDPIPLQWDRWTRAQLRDAIANATDGEFVTEILPDGTEVLDLLRQAGADAPVWPLYYGGGLVDHELEEDYQQLATAVRVVGEQPTADSERATIGENLWRVTSVRADGAGNIAVALRTQAGTDSPVLEDGQYASHPDIGVTGCFLEYADGITRRAILDSFADTGEVLVSAPGPAVGDRVAIVAAADGTPLEVLELPSAIRAYGRVVGDVTIAGGRGERQYLDNGGHATGIERWEAVNGGVAAEYRRTDFGTVRTALANGARLAGATTPFAIDGLPANEPVRQGVEIRIGEVTCVNQSDALPTPAGAVSLSIAPGLPGAYADNTPFTLERKERRVLTLDGAHSVMLPLFGFTNSNTSNLNEFRDLGAYVSAVSGSYTTATNGTFLYRHPVNRAGAVLLQVSPAFLAPGIAWPTSGADLRTFAANSFGCTATTATFTCAAWVRPTVGDRIAYAAPSGEAFVVTTVDGRVISVRRWVLTVTSVVDLGDGEVYAVTATPVVPTWATSVAGLYGQLPFAQQDEFGTSFVSQCNTSIAGASSWTVTVTRETKTVYTDGSHPSGAVTLNLKPIPEYATRNWVSTDTIELPRDLSATLRVTAITSVTNNGGGTGGTYTVTVDLAASTMDSFALTDDWLVGEVFFRVRIGMLDFMLRLDSLVGTTAVLRRTTGTLSVSDFTTPVTLTTSWRHYDTYALTGTASWAATGLVTLTLASAVPAGRSYAAGLPAWSPTWHSRGTFGLNTDLRVNALVNAGAGTVQLAGNDGLVGSSGRKALVIIHGGAGTSQLPIAGNTLYAASTVLADGSGAASVPITAANTNAIADNAAVTLTVPPLLPSGFSTVGSAMRLFSAVGGSGIPTSASPGQQHTGRFVRVPEGSTRQLIVTSVFALSDGEWFAGQGPVVALVDLFGSVLASASLDDEGLSVDATNRVVTLTCSFAVPGGTYAVRVYGGTTDYARWCVHFQSMLYVGEALGVPYTSDSFATPLMLTGLRRLRASSVPRIADRLTAVEFARAFGGTDMPVDAIPRPVLGGTIRLLDWNRDVRIVAIEEAPGVPFASIEVGQPAADGYRVLAANAVSLNTRAR